MLRKTTSNLALALMAGAFTIAGTGASLSAAACVGDECPTASIHDKPMLLTHQDKCIEAKLNFERASWLEEHTIKNGNATETGVVAGWQQMAIEAATNAQVQSRLAEFNRVRAAEFPEQAEFWNQQTKLNDSQSEQWKAVAERYSDHAKGMREEAKLHQEAAFDALEECSSKTAEVEEVESNPVVVAAVEPRRVIKTVKVRRPSAKPRKRPIHNHVENDEPFYPGSSPSGGSNTQIHVDLGLGPIFGGWPGVGPGRPAGRPIDPCDDPATMCRPVGGDPDPTPDPAGDETVDVPSVVGPVRDVLTAVTPDDVPSVGGPARTAVTPDGGIVGILPPGITEPFPGLVPLPGSIPLPPITPTGDDGDRGETGTPPVVVPSIEHLCSLVPWSPRCAREEIGSAIEALTATGGDEPSVGGHDRTRSANPLARNRMMKQRYKHKRNTILREAIAKKRIERIRKVKLRKARLDRNRINRVKKRKIRETRVNRKRAQHARRSNSRVTKRNQRRVEKRRTRINKRNVRKNRRATHKRTKPTNRRLHKANARNNRRLRKVNNTSNRRVRNQQRRSHLQERSVRPSSARTGQRPKKQQRRRSSNRVRAFKG
jgi:hypothetical protein